MKKLTFLLLLISPLCSGQIHLSENARISVLTLGPWQGELFTAFGHSAIRVHDPLNRFDAVYNYGVFDFNQPNFYINFARGYNLYMLGVGDYQRFAYAYISDNRYIHEQVLNLTQERKQRLFDYLQWNARPENKDYLYDYFYDNCATKVPEVVLKVLGDTVTFDSSHLQTGHSIRELTDLYLSQQPWGDLGIDICLGLPTDKKASAYEHMFLPDYVEAGFANATIMVDGVAEPLVSETNIVYQSKPEPQPGPSFFHPLVIFTIIFIATSLLTYRDIKRNKLVMIYDAVLFTVVGIVGIVLLLLWTATNHKAAANNFNLIWALPTHIIAVIAFLRQPRWLEKYFLAVLIITGILLITWPFIPQKLHYFLIPLILAIALRAYAQFAVRRRGSL